MVYWNSKLNDKGMSVKELMIVITACATALTGFAADPLEGLTKFYWNNPDGGNWNTAANWVMADGSTATTYPQSATDAAIFNGINSGKWISCNADTELGAIYLEDGWIGFKLVGNKAFHVANFLREDYATLSLVKSGGYTWDQANIDFKVGNKDDVQTDLCFCGVQWLKQDNGWGAPYSVTIDESGAVKNTSSGFQSEYKVTSTKTWDGHYSLLFGNYQGGRNLWFSGDFTLTIPSGQIMHHNANHVGTPTSSQGTIASDEPVLFWSSTSGGANFRPLIQAPKFVQASRYTTVYYDQHSAETCSYWIPQGTLQLGKSGAEDLTATCKLGTGDVNVSWSGTLSVQCAGALEKVGAIRMTSYRGQGTTWGKISMGVSDSVNSVTLDGQALAAGTYGATGSGAANIDDDHFAGTGVLTVLGGSVTTPSGVLIIVE